MRVTLIHNPGAGTHGAPQLEALQQLIRTQGHDLRTKSCKDDDWTAALDAPADLVAVAGGDGTVARVAKALIGRGVPVAPVPAGTANNISTALGLTGRPVEELVQQWAGSRTVKLDVGIAQGPWGRRYFIEGVGCGLFASAVPAVDSSAQIKDLEPRERVAFALRKLKRHLEKLEPVRIEATLDDESVSGEYLLFEAMNVPYIGPNLFLAPDSERGDGRFDLVMATAQERDRLLHYLEVWQDEKARLAVLPTRQGRRLEVQWTGFPVHIDDEFWPEEGTPFPSSPAHMRAQIDGAVEFLVPAEGAKKA